MLHEYVAAQPSPCNYHLIRFSVPFALTNMFTIDIGFSEDSGSLIFVAQNLSSVPGTR